MKYDIDDKPRPLEMLLYAAQWFCIIVPTMLVLAGVVANMQFDDPVLRSIYSRKLFMIIGAGLLVQVFFGHKLPLMLGPASVLLVGMLSVEGASVDSVYTAVALGGIFLGLVSFGKFFKLVRKIITPRIVVVILILVALSLAPLILKLSTGAENHFSNFLFSLVLASGMLLFNAKFKGVWKSSAILFGVVLGSVFYLCFLGEYSPRVEADYDWRVFFDNLIITPQFDISVISAFFMCFLVLFINELGSIYAVGALVEKKDLDVRGKRGLRVIGAVNFVSGAFGVVGSVDYSTSPGIIASTGCASRYPVALAGLMIVICAIFPQSVSLLGLIPDTVMGATLLYIMGAQLASGVVFAVRDKSVGDINDGLVIGFPVMIAILVSFAPKEFFDGIPPLLQPILGNGFNAGCISALVLEHLVFRVGTHKIRR